ncbi:MAG: RluA family pseudouridine synthase [Muribaculaceae bacterium]|nr:RluA family pseudouridine synthase [Muribaculaceae bacterium]
MREGNFRRSSDGRNRNVTGPDRILEYVNEGESSFGLMDFIASRRPDSKRNDIKKWLRFGHLMVNGHVTTAFDSPVEPGDMVRLNTTRPFVTFRHPRVEIVYEDDDVIVINKGYGLLSVGAQNAKKEINAYDIIRNYIKEVDPRNKLFIVHRLDRDTSGLMMFAKSQEAQEVLRHNWNNMVLERLYVAVLEGNLEQESGYVKSRLMENSQFKVYSTDDPNQGKLAVTHYKVLGRGNNLTLAEFSLDTGRKNQIRVHASDLGHPISGDRKYGAKKSPLHRLALHARTLRFAHPITRKDMYFETPIPVKFQTVLRRQNI